MMNTKRAVFVAVIGLAVAGLTVPLMSMKAAASGSGTMKANSPSVKTTNSTPKQQQIEQQRDGSGEARAEGQGKISADTLKALGITRANNAREASAKIAEKLLNKKKSG